MAVRKVLNKVTW